MFPSKHKYPVSLPYAHISPYTHKGVGDDPFSWAYDGGRLRRWNGMWDVRGEPYGEAVWKKGDIVGCILDLDKGTMRY